MAQLMREFGINIHINVVDTTCRYYNWDKYKPRARPIHTLGKGFQTVGDWMAQHVSPYLADPLLRVGTVFADEVPSAAATEAANEYQPEGVVLDDGQSFPVEKWYYDGRIKLSTLPNVCKLKIRKEGSSVVVVVTSTGLLSTHYNQVLFSIGPHKQLIDTTTLFKDDQDQDRIINVSSLEITHDIEVFYVLIYSSKIMITLKRNSNPAMSGIESLLPDTETNGYLTLVSLESGLREWMFDPRSVSFFNQVYNTVVRIEARRPKPRSRSRSLTAGGRKKQKKRRTRRLRVKTNKSNKTRFRYSASYRKTQ
jgi:hypothetical protein